MPAKARSIRPGRQTATPYLVVNDAAEALDFYKRAFGAKEILRVERNGKVGHAQIRIGNSRIMVSDEHPDTGVRAPQSFGGSPVRIFLYVPNVDNFVGRAVAIGAKLQQPVDDKLYGDRSGSLEDPFGHIWHVATRRENLSPDEIQQRAQSLLGHLEPPGDADRPAVEP
ncbi:MAG TPA: VOC family protein [Burkholderiales bacterium]|nr:VOC family protein [Burkholderiales bacterium]